MYKLLEMGNPHHLLPRPSLALIHADVRSPFFHHETKAWWRLQRIVADELCDPLQPLDFVNLSSTTKGLRAAMDEQLQELKRRHAEAAALRQALRRSASAADWAQLR